MNVVRCVYQILDYVAIYDTITEMVIVELIDNQQQWQGDDQINSFTMVK